MNVCIYTFCGTYSSLGDVYGNEWSSRSVIMSDLGDIKKKEKRSQMISALADNAQHKRTPVFMETTV